MNQEKTISSAQEKLIVALDVDTFEEARAKIDQLKDDVGVFKIGSQLFTACGPVVVRYCLAKGRKVFLDLKFHDIPNTVANAVKSAVLMTKVVHDLELKDNQDQIPEKGLFMCTVHTLGGEEMLRRAVESATKASESIGVTRPLIVGITVLTSDVKRDNIRDLVLERATLAKKSGLDGVVASSLEAQMIRQEFGKDFVIVTPGIRPKGADAQDQKRVTTPKEAIENGSDFLVVGRPIMQADDPALSAKKIIEEIESAE